MNTKERQFVKTVWAFYSAHGRHELPWRKTRDPYKILVSELMCQQTQVFRVVPKYKDFIKTFPSVSALASASLGDVLRKWQGLGYNRRAKYLHACAKEICTRHQGRVPKTRTELQALTGVGPYTAGAVLAFAYNTPEVIIETNIRTLFLKYFFPRKEAVDDNEVLRLVQRTLDVNNPREWYAALMDYGAHIKKTEGNQNHRSRHYKKQSRFKGSDREIRGALLRTLSKRPYSKKALERSFTFPRERTRNQLDVLVKEGFLIEQNEVFTLPQ